MCANLVSLFYLGLGPNAYKRAAAKLLESNGMAVVDLVKDPLWQV
jgi:hypothetical protein